MKNNTFNQIINANLASIDPGFGQFALAFRSSLLAGVFALVVGECQVTLIDSELISVAVRRADWRRA